VTAILPLDNNASEGALRTVALGRKNFLFVGHDEAGADIAGLYSLVATCEANGINPEAYLSDVLLRVQSEPQSRIDELLPHRWSEATAGFGVAVLATWALPGSRREFRSLRLGPRGLLRTWRAVHLRQAPDTPTLRKVVELIGYELGRLERAGRLSVVRRPGHRRGARAA